ncbi:MAG: acyl-CoA desaturase [Cyanobacteria bacterium P01_H01_bin.15]
MSRYSPFTTVSYLMPPVLIIAGHLGSLLLITTGISWGSFAWLLFLYEIRMLATTAIYHRLLTHRSYQADIWVLRIGCLLATTAGQMGPSWWKAHHLAHHRHTDTPLDPHSPYVPIQGIKGFLWSHGGWLFSYSQLLPKQLPRDVECDLFLKVLDRWHFVPVLAVAALSFALGGNEYLGAFCLSTTFLYHGVASVNSLSHVQGTQPFKTNDQSRNNALVAVLALGEGWHNLHHAFQSSIRHGITISDGTVKYLPDPTFRFIQLLGYMGLASKFKMPREEKLLAKARIKTNPTVTADLLIPETVLKSEFSVQTTQQSSP